MSVICNINSFKVKYMVNRKKEIPLEFKRLLVTLGQRIQIARKRRNLTLKDMAEKMFVSRQTVSRLEHGDEGVTLSVLVSALWVLGLSDEISLLAMPENDKAGIFMERKKLPKRVRNKNYSSKLDF